MFSLAPAIRAGVEYLRQRWLRGAQRSSAQKSLNYCAYLASSCSLARRYHSTFPYHQRHGLPNKFGCPLIQSVGLLVEIKKKQTRDSVIPRPPGAPSSRGCYHHGHNQSCLRIASKDSMSPNKSDSYPVPFSRRELGCLLGIKPGVDALIPGNNNQQKTLNK